MKFLLASVLSVVTVSGAALAADLPSRAAPAAPPAVAPAFTWTGFYVGVNAGYLGGDGDTNVSGIGTATQFAPALGAFDTAGSGFIGGAQVGYNQQFGSFVFGAEADIQYTDVSKSIASASSVNLGIVFPTNLGLTSELEYLGTVRVRAGYAIDRALLYVTGGLAYGQVKTAVSYQVVGPTPSNWNGSATSMQAGWTVGGGIEYAFTSSITGKVEYLYYDLGDTSVTTNAIGSTALAVSSNNRGNIVRAGLNWKFGL